LINNFKISKSKVFPVPHGVDKRFIFAKPNLFIKKYGLNDFILYVGRIDIRKNVLSLIRSLKNTKIDLVIIGKTEPDQQFYFEKCKKEASKNIHFLGQFDHESKLLESAYAAAKVVTLPADYETPGLVGLEAGLAKANIVITEKGSTKDYYKNYVWYINPNNLKDIKNKLLKAYNSEKNNDLRNHIKKNFLWSKVAKRTLEGYKKVL
jgi:glycosyltransferase involved in cell wall biosynthesis